MRSKYISRFHFITQEMAAIPVEHAVLEALDAGADWIQLRMKTAPYAEQLQCAERVKATCDRFGATLIINDQIELARTVGAQGVHLGRDDMNPGEARRIYPNGIIGGTANSVEDALHLIEAQVDYIGLGPLRFTSTKKKLAPILGLAGIAPVIERCNRERMPVIVIGGITAEDISVLLDLGADGVAVSQAIYGAKTIAHGVEQCLHALGGNRGIASNS